MRAGRVSGVMLVAALTLCVLLGATGVPGGAATKQPVTITLAPKPGSTPNPAAAEAALVKRLHRLGINGTVEQSGEQLVVTLPHGAGDHTADEVVPGELRFRPVLAELSRVAGPDGVTASPEAVRSCDVAAVTAATYAEPTSPDADLADVCIVADTPTGVSPASRYLLGPAALGGADVKAAKAQFVRGNGWVVLMDLDPTGQDRFNQLAAKLFEQQSPANRVAFVVDRRVESSPSFQSDSFSGPVQISGGGTKGFTKAEVRKLADAVNVGASALGAYEVSSVTPA